MTRSRPRTQRPAPSGGPPPAPTTAQDRIYAEERRHIADFNFGADTAAVFDDMLNRSVPYYAEIQRMVAELAADFIVDGTNVYDIGCSTCATFRALAHVNKDVTFVGIDSSESMLARADAELKAARFPGHYELRHQDLHQGVQIENASVVIMCLTLQFVRPLYRERLMQAVYNGITHPGCLILVEKVLSPDTLINRLFIKYYYDFKRRNGYSDTEIAQKREALENVLVPYRYEENVALLQAAGFRCVESFFRWYNFTGLVALK